MTLETILKDIGADEDVYIGIEGGAAWLWIMPRRELERKKGVLEAKLLKHAKEKTLTWKKNTTTRMNAYIIAKESLKIYREMFAGGRYLGELEANYRSAENFMKLAFEKRASWDDYYNNWIPLWEREVVDIYPQDIDDKGWCIIVKGNKEQGYKMFKDDKDLEDLWAVK